MTFSEYWKDNEPFGCDAEGVARLAFNAAVAAERERCARILREYYRQEIPGSHMQLYANGWHDCAFQAMNDIRSGK